MSSERKYFLINAIGVFAGVLLLFVAGTGSVRSQQSGPGSPIKPGAVNLGVPGQGGEGNASIEGGGALSGSVARSHIIENERPERVQVYPDDPESAWWEVNPSYAFARAQREQKPLLLLFTGIWNTQAMGLSQEVFSTKSFNEYVKENLVICYLSYPRNITDAPQELRRLKEKFKVRGYPNVLLFNPRGEVYRGLRGYRTGRPVDYFGKLRVACRPVLEAIKVQKTDLRKHGFRDWSNYLGKVIFAKFVRRDDHFVALLDVSGVEWFIPLNDLAPDDQRIVESFPKGPKIVLPSEKAKK